MQLSVSVTALPLDVRRRLRPAGQRGDTTWATPLVRALPFERTEVEPLRCEVRCIFLHSEGRARNQGQNPNDRDRSPAGRSRLTSSGKAVINDDYRGRGLKPRCGICRCSVPTADQTTSA